jgi:hypothetical protein
MLSTSRIHGSRAVVENPQVSVIIVRHKWGRLLYSQLKPYTFDLTLRLRHPRIRHDEISRNLNLHPRFKWNAGAPRLRPDGTELGGIHDHTYWACKVARNKSESLIDALNTNISALELHRAFLQDFVATGGQIEFFVGWFTTKISGGDTLTWELLARLAELRIDLSLDVYGDSQEGIATRDNNASSA